MYVSSRNTHSIKQYDFPSGGYINDIVKSGSGGLSYPQEVLLHPDGFLLVTGRGNSSIKKYSAENGSYLGNFTNGYSLDNPTKTTIWNDSVVYVSQWGTAKNKVVRFRLKDGLFIDEFTSIGMHNPGGHAWDSKGNLFVAQYANGNDGSVLQFDTKGQLIDTFIPTGAILGPVNLWYNFSDNTLCVADWTLGDVLAFDGESGEFIRTMVQGLQNVEGYSFDSEGNLYLCDWTANKVYKYNETDDDLKLFTDEGNLASPNSICIVEENNTSVHEVTLKETASVQAYPNIFHSTTSISMTIKHNGYHTINIRDLSGEIICTLYNNYLESGNHRFLWRGVDSMNTIVASGIYFVEVISADEKESCVLIKE